MGSGVQKRLSEISVIGIKLTGITGKASTGSEQLTAGGDTCKCSC